MLPSPLRRLHHYAKDTDTREDLACRLRQPEQSNKGRGSTRSRIHPAGGGVQHVPGAGYASRPRPGKRGGAGCIEDRQPVPRTNTSVNNTNQAGHADTEGSNGKGEGRKDQAMTSFDAEPVLDTEHDDVASYLAPTTDLLLAVNGQQPFNNDRHARVYHKWVHLQGPEGENIRIKAIIDGGAMKNTMCKRTWNAQQHRLGPLHPSRVTLSMADNHCILSEGKWAGVIEVAGTKMAQALEVFDSKGAFQVILGKPWLRDIQAIHRYRTDQITNPVQELTVTINNNNEAKDEAHTPGQKEGQTGEPIDSLGAVHRRAAAAQGGTGQVALSCNEKKDVGTSIQHDT